MKLNFDHQHTENRHVCRSIKRGDWIIYQCPKCDYVMKQHFETGELIIENAKADIHHSGTFRSPAFIDAIKAQN